MNTICVFLGSGQGRLEDKVGIRALVEEIKLRGGRIVFGGASPGMMGFLATTAGQSGCELLGVALQLVIDRGIGFHDCELKVARTPTERLDMMTASSDGCVVMPGGVGTMEELFGVMARRIWGEYSAPIGLLKVAGYFDQLIAFLEHGVQQGYIRHVDREPSSLIPTRAGF